MSSGGFFSELKAAFAEGWQEGQEEIDKEERIKESGGTASIEELGEKAELFGLPDSGYEFSKDEIEQMKKHKLGIYAYQKPNLLFYTQRVMYAIWLFGLIMFVGGTIMEQAFTVLVFGESSNDPLPQEYVIHGLVGWIISCVLFMFVPLNIHLLFSKLEDGEEYVSNGTSPDGRKKKRKRRKMRLRKMRLVSKPRSLKRDSEIPPSGLPRSNPFPMTPPSGLPPKPAVPSLEMQGKYSDDGYEWLEWPQGSGTWYYRGTPNGQWSFFEQ